MTLNLTPNLILSRPTLTLTQLRPIGTVTTSVHRVRLSLSEGQSSLKFNNNPGSATACGCACDLCNTNNSDPVCLYLRSQV